MFTPLEHQFILFLVKRIETLSDLRNLVFHGIADALKVTPSSRRDEIGSDIIGEWFGEKPKHQLKHEPTPYDIFVWRVVYLSKALGEINWSLELARSIPNRKFGMPHSEQLELCWWLYFSKTTEFQERIWKLFECSAALTTNEVNKSRLQIRKKEFLKKYMGALRGVIQMRDHWVHDSAPEFEQLKRLSSVELFHRFYAIDHPQDACLVRFLRREASKIRNQQKKFLISTIENNQPVIEKLADGVVSYLMQHISLPHRHTI